MQKKLKIFFLFILLLMLLPAVYANAGIILIVLFVPPLILSLLPIILIEASTYKHFLHISFLKTLFPVSLANIITTLFGLPLSWVVLGYIQMKLIFI